MTQGYPSPINNAAASSDLLPTRARRMAVEITKNLLQGVPVDSRIGGNVKVRLHAFGPLSSHKATTEARKSTFVKNYYTSA
ncbi:hypothetical protein ACIQH7_13355 [Streptomyces anulatus]|uniref:hypothetical protein n=1 Tax=Streptomyces anulatus TaxID=1892 RepID=UPI0036B8CFB7